VCPSRAKGAWGVLRKLSPSRSLTASDLVSFRHQESLFIALNLLLLAVLFSLHWYFAAFWGKPTPLLIIAVTFGFVLKTAEWFWLQRLSRPLTPAALAALTWSSIALNITLASLLALLTDQEDTPYFVLMVVAVLEAAFRFRVLAILAVVAVVDTTLFGQVWWYFGKHPPLDVGEYYEAGITSLLFAIVGVLVWLLLADLRLKEDRLADNVLELEQAREQLLHDEKLAAMGRLSSAIAHEIRNPVAMIASSIATARQLTGADREEMLAWMKPLAPGLKKVFLVHGEPDQQRAFQAAIHTRYGLDVAAGFSPHAAPVTHQPAVAQQPQKAAKQSQNRIQEEHACRFLSVITTSTRPSRR